MKYTFVTGSQFEKTPIKSFVESYMEHKNREGESLSIKIVTIDETNHHLYHVEYKCPNTNRIVKIEVLHNPRNYANEVTEIFDSLQGNS